MRSRAMKWLLGVLVAVGLLTLPVLLDNQFYLHHVTIIFLFSVVALGYWLIYRTGQVSFAQAGFMMIGAYTTASLTKFVGRELLARAAAFRRRRPRRSRSRSGSPTLRLRGAYFFLITFAFGEVIRLFFNNAWESVFGGVRGIHKIPDPSALEIPVPVHARVRQDLRGKDLVLLSRGGLLRGHHGGHAPDRSDPGRERPSSGCAMRRTSPKRLGCRRWPIGSSLSLSPPSSPGWPGGSTPRITRSSTR